MTGKIVRAGLLAALAAASLAACSGGGGGSGPSTPLPPVSPPPAPPPPPPPPPPPAPPVQPPSFFETREYFGSGFVGDNRSGLGQIGASSAYSRGATGEGVLVAVIDTNIDTTISELTGQVAGTFDVRAGVRAANDIDSDGHSTMVTSVIVARRDNANTGVHGVAFDSKVLAIRADREGSCLTTGENQGCRFRDADLVTAINYAVAQGAKVINMSLGGAVDNDPTVENAIRAAVNAGVLVVIAAGNEGAAATATEAAKGLSPEEPAYIAGQAASRGRVVAVGAVDRSGQLATFSNRAGQTQNFYLLAPGVSVITAGVDDNIRLPSRPSCSATVTTACNDTDDDGDYWAASGTSFAAPHVAGALALMLDLFPNITPENALAALLSTATDFVGTGPDPIRGEVAGVGVDAVSGVGILNLARAFAPIGPTSLTFAGEDVPLSVLLSPASGATGDWAEESGAFDGVVFQDMFDRGFRIGEAQLGQSRAPFGDFGLRADYARGQARALEIGPAQLSWFSAPRPAYDPRRPWAEAPDPTFTVRYNLAGSQLAAGRGGGPERIAPGMMLANDPSGAPVLGARDGWASVSHEFGPMTLDLRSSSGEGRSLASAGVAREGDGWAMRLGLTSMEDRTSALGGALQSRFGQDDASRLSAVGFEASRDAGSWRFSGSVEGASAQLSGAAVDGLWTSSWSLSAERPLGVGALRLSAGQPRRAEGGALTFEAPVEVLKSGALRYETRTAELTPSGRELDIEAAWVARLARDLTFEAAGALMLHPNHVADAKPAAAFWTSLRYQW